MTSIAIKPKDRDLVLQALRAGVVPRTGHQHFQVGRASEVEALMRDLKRVADGGSAFKLIVGEFGSGKTFFLSLIRAIAQQQNMVTIQADLTPDRRLHASGGQGRALYVELVRNLATRTRPEGGAIESILERFINSALSEAQEKAQPVDRVISHRLGSLTELVGGYDFASVVGAYWRGYDSGNEQLTADAIRWLRGEFTTKTDAKNALSVRTIVDDANVYDQLKLLARFVRLAGYSGLIICLDELVNLYKLPNSQARNTNYEQILRILNDSLQGSAEYLGILMGGTPEFLMDPRRGLYSYPALQSRLAENEFATKGLVDYTGPVIRLANLGPEDVYVLLEKLRHLYALGDANQYLLPDEGIEAFLAHCSQRLGDAFYRTPRNTITAFINLMAVLEQNPGTSWTEHLARVSIPSELRNSVPPVGLPGASGVSEPESGEDSSNDLVSFRL